MRALRHLLTASIFFAAAAPDVLAQSRVDADKDAAYAAVTKLFDAMRARDTVTMRASFVPNASMQSLTPQGVTFDSIGGWISSVARARAGLLLDERLANPVVQVSGDLASVWVDYWFYAGDRFSHCGVDAIHLYRLAGVWRIFSIVDTRQREGCPPAPAGTNPE